MKANSPEDQIALDRSLKDALLICRRLTKCRDSSAHSAALRFVAELRKLGAVDND